MNFADKQGQKQVRLHFAERKSLCPDFYPTSGYRASNSGILGNVGESGYAWSNAPSSATDIYGSKLDFGNFSVTTEGNGLRAHAFPVRCMQE